MTSARQIVKRVAERVLAGTPARVARSRRAADTLVIAYHNVVPHGEQPAGDRSLHLAQRAFGQQLDHLATHYDVVSLHDAMPTPAPGATRRRPRVVITFDDAYLGALTAGLEELQARGLPATVFVAPGFLGGRAFWWDMIASPAGLDPSARESALTAGRGLTDAVVALAERAGHTVQAPAPWARCASLETVDASVATGLLTVGSHTWNHPNLTRLDDGELATELDSTRHWLQRFGDRAVDAITYPYGLADSRVRAAAVAAGYALGFMVDGGWTRMDGLQGTALPRLNVPAGLSQPGFIARVAGVLAAR